MDSLRELIPLRAQHLPVLRQLIMLPSTETTEYRRLRRGTKAIAAFVSLPDTSASGARFTMMEAHTRVPQKGMVLQRLYEQAAQ